MMHIHDHASLESMTAVWLLPIVPTVVAAASGGFVAPLLAPSTALIVIVVSWLPCMACCCSLTRMQMASACSCSAGHTPEDAVLQVSYMLWGIGMALSLIVMATYFHRLTVHNLPVSEAIVSAFLPLGEH
jgi:tellurite resistance protein TehA-like permease